jgi:hypothetical protein
MTTPPVRIAVGQPVATQARQSLMIGSQELQAFTYRQPYHLGYADVREQLLHTLRSEFGRTADLPTQAAPEKVQQKTGQQFATLVVYLVVVDDTHGKRNEPVLIPEDEVLPWVFGYVLGRSGPVAAQRVSYRPEMLTTP